MGRQPDHFVLMSVAPLCHLTSPAVRLACYSQAETWNAAWLAEVHSESMSSQLINRTTFHP